MYDRDRAPVVPARGTACDRARPLLHVLGRGFAIECAVVGVSVMIALVAALAGG